MQVPSSRPPTDLDHRTRLIEAMAAAVAEKGYAETTIADIVRHARVSKRTFYEHFPDKEACFLSAYKLVAAELLGRIAQAVAGLPSIDEQIDAAMRAYFEALEERPELTRTFLSEIHAAGPAALELRRKIHQQFADLLRNLVEQARKQLPGSRPFSRELATAVVGGINELLLLTIDEGRSHRLHEVKQAATELLRATVLSLAQPAELNARPARRR